MGGQGCFELPEQGGFATAGGTGNHQKFPGGDVKGQTLQSGDGLPGVGKGQVLDRK